MAGKSKLNTLHVIQSRTQSVSGCAPRFVLTARPSWHIPYLNSRRGLQGSSLILPLSIHELSLGGAAIVIHRLIIMLLCSASLDFVPS